MRSSFLVVVCALLFVVCSMFVARVSADGSIQPFIDVECQRPLANVSTIPMVATPNCQYVTAHDGTVTAFSYQCNVPSNIQSGNFSFALWSNASSYNPCIGAPDWSITATQVFTQDCSVATYDDAGNSVSFYAEIQCYAIWPKQEEERGASGVAEAERAVKNVEQIATSAQQDIVHTLAALVPRGKSSAIHRLAQQLKEQGAKEQQAQ